MKWKYTLFTPFFFLITKIPENAKSLLDIGGSHGLYSVDFCEKYPDLRADILA